MAELLEDLDGDGTRERIVIMPDEVRIGDHAVKLAIADESTVQVLDIDRKTPARELAISPQVIENNLSIVLFTYDGKTIVVSEPAYFGNEPELKRDGRMIATYNECGVIHTVVYKLTKAKLVKVSSKQRGKRDPDACSA